MNNFAQYLLIISFLFASIGAIITYRHSKGKYRFALLITTLLGCLITFYAGWSALTEHKQRQEVLKGYLDGGSAIPRIDLGKTTDNFYFAFYLANLSRTYSLYDIRVWGIRVSTDNAFVYRKGNPPEILTDSFLQPDAMVQTKIVKQAFQFNQQTPEYRYNFFIRCKNGFFTQQMVIREVNGQLKRAIRVMKDDKVIYQNEIDPDFLFPQEKELIFQDQNEGAQKGSMEEEYQKWQQKAPYITQEND